MIANDTVFCTGSRCPALPHYVIERKNIKKHDFSVPIMVIVAILTNATI